MWVEVDQRLAGFHIQTSAGWIEHDPREILAKVPTPNNAVLIAVSPDQRAIEVVYGSGVRDRISPAAAPQGVATAASALAAGQLIDGLVSAVQVISAGIARA